MSKYCALLGTWSVTKEKKKNYYDNQSTKDVTQSLYYISLGNTSRIKDRNRRLEAELSIKTSIYDWI